MIATREQDQQLVNRMAEYAHDPLGYVLYAFPWGVPGTQLAGSKGPRKWQREKLLWIGEQLRGGAGTNSVIRDATCSGHGIGKSALLSMLIKWALDTMADARVVVTANTDKQLQNKTWPELSKWHHLSITKHWFTFTATSLYSAVGEHEKTWRADAIPWSEHNTEAFQGLHNVGRRIVLLYDEASRIADTVWEVSEGALTDAETEILWLVFGNGTRATGHFRECFRKFRHRWHATNIDSREVEGTNLALFNQWVEDYGEDDDFVKVRVRGMFPAASFQQFISETDVDAGFARHYGEPQYVFAPKVMGVDPSWSGEDATVIGVRQGLVFTVLRSIPKNDNDVELANTIARLEDELDADAVMVDAGYGTGVVSAGRAMGRTWTLVWFAEKPFDEGFLNKRSEMWGGVKTWLKEGGALRQVKDRWNQELRDDLIGPETVPRLDGKIQLESKMDMKGRGLPSPNMGDCLALTFAHPVQAKHREVGGPLSRPKIEVEWDPFAELGR